MGEIQQNKYNLTRSSFFSLRISPDFMRTASATQSAAATQTALISLQSTLNSLLPDFTFAIE
jgi:hypothetical protein